MVADDDVGCSGVGGRNWGRNVDRASRFGVDGLRLFAGEHLKKVRVPSVGSALKYS